ncbi:MAG TPA: hypothetical protein VLY63_05235, partial [Anaerolineae bacterium]|nr:hypothetical protein [Anaerolineae bacterium]
MAQKQTESGWLAQIWGAWWGLIVIACLFLIPTILCALLVWAGRFPAGFDEYAPSVPGAEREMTFRAWIDLLLIPLSLAAGAVLLGWLADRRETAAGARRAQADQEAQERRLLADREIQMDRSRE